MENIETLLAAVAQTAGFDDDEPVVSTSPKLGFENSESSSVIRGDISGSQLIGEVSGDARSSAVVDTPFAAPTPAFPAVGRVIGAGEKKKRGRPPRGQLAVNPPPPKRKKVEDEEEDVCFICFDGGSLVLCDRKACPKAYHPACIKRDEAFFKSKAKWNCGWHICSVCRKASHYMCYTCTYSLCKGCTKDADFVCVRGNKGFCSTCMKTIMLIENKDQANNESIQVDFDDKSSWEYLFKVYWVILKEKLSLTLISGEVPISFRSTDHLELNKPHVEISSIQNDGLRTAQPSIGNHVEKLNNDKEEDAPSHDKDAVKPSMDEVTDETSIDKATEVPGIKEATEVPGIKEATEVPGIKEATDEPIIEKDQDDPSTAKDTDKPCICKNINDKESYKPGIYSSTEWATKDLLEFVAHMKNGDTSALSQFDVQTLLFDYIKRNNLRDPRQKSQIEDSPKNSFIPAGFVSSVASDMEVDENIYGLPTPVNNRKRKTRKKSEERAPQTNLNEYAAIDVYNINLIYLRRNLMENLIEDHENFNNKVIGSIVRIRISSNDQKQDVYRLVQVVGTTKVGEPYKIGDRTADVMLEVLNLDKKEVVSIDAISNQVFTEDECRRLRQSIRCGLVKQFTVGEVQKKAMALQPVRVNDWLEAEVSRLNHLRDRASEKGLFTLRECVDKLQLLKSPERRRISEVPEIHADPKMNPNYESEEDTRSGGDNSKKEFADAALNYADEYVRPSYSGFLRSGRKPISPNKKVIFKIMNRSKEERSIQTRNRLIEKTDASGSNSSDKHMTEVSITNSAISGMNDQATQSSEMEYNRLFPPDMRIWTNHEQYDSLLLTDALNGKFHLASELSNSGPREDCATGENGVSEGTNMSGREQDSVLSDNNTGPVRADESGSWPQCWDLLKDNNSSANDVEARNLLPSSSPEKTNAALPDRAQEIDDIYHGSQNGEKNSTGLTQNPLTTGLELQNHASNEDRVGPSSEENLISLNIDLSSNDIEPGSVFAPPDSNKQSCNLNVLDLSSPTPNTAENQHSVSLDVSMQKSVILELLSPTPRSNNEGQPTETKQSEFMNFPVPNPGQGWSGVQLPEVADEWCGYSPTPAKPSVQEWDSALASASLSKPPEITSENIAASTSDNQQLMPNWLSIINEPIEFDALGEESVSDLLAEVDAMELQGTLPSPTSAMKFARELIEDLPGNPIGASPINAFDSLTRSSVHSSASNEVETNAGSEFHPPAPNMTQDMVGGAAVGSGMGSDTGDPGWGTVQGNINLVTVQGNVNLVLGGPGWGTNPGTGWVNPNLNPSPRNGSLPWDGQRKYGGERFSSPREWGYQGRPPWGRQPPYGGGGYSRPLPKGQRVSNEVRLIDTASQLPFMRFL
ncbi:hypothetical protein DH2020_015493 [Rehmannia glutinosa]|uniref:Uncharacterized protein n=1 Tax=Rehmannia glutinosa TaxID=99300 RepID=A0ABR0WTE7_REHGL